MAWRVPARCAPSRRRDQLHCGTHVTLRNCSRALLCISHRPIAAGAPVYVKHMPIESSVVEDQGRCEIRLPPQPKYVSRHAARYGVVSCVLRMCIFNKYGQYTQRRCETQLPATFRRPIWRPRLVLARRRRPRWVTVDILISGPTQPGHRVLRVRYGRYEYHVKHVYTKARSSHQAQRRRRVLRSPAVGPPVRRKSTIIIPCLSLFRTQYTIRAQGEVDDRPSAAATSSILVAGECTYVLLLLLLLPLLLVQTDARISVRNISHLFRISLPS